MATAALNTRYQPIYNRTKEAPSVNKDLQEIIDKVRKLQQLTKSTGFHTTRSVAQLMANLTPDELVTVSEALHLTELNQR
jgi:negative regulator of replication initiation